MKSTMRGIAAAAVLLGTTIGTANAALVLVQNNGVPDTAQAEAQNLGGPGFPLGIVGFQHDAELRVDAPGFYRFTFIGAGNAGNNNSFTVTGGGTFLSFGPGGLGAGTTPLNTSFDVFFGAPGIIPFTYTTSYPGTSAAPECSIANGSNSTTSQETCHYLVALAASPGPVPATGPQNVAYIGFSDLPDTDFDFQDLTVRVEALVPAPASLALLGAALAGVGLTRRRKA